MARAESAPTRPLRLLVIGGYAPSLVVFRGELLKALVAAGCEVVAVAAEDDPVVAARLADWGVRYQPLALHRHGTNPLAELATLARYRQMIRALRPEAVLAYTIKPVVWGLLAARLAGVRRRYALITGLGYAFGDGGLRRRLLGMTASALYRLGLAGVRRAIFQNPDDAAEFVGRGLVRREQVARVNGSGVDLAHYACSPPTAGPEIGVLLIARLLGEKGIHEYADAAARLRQRYPQLRFRLAGFHDGGPDGIPPATVAGWTDSGLLDYLGPLSDVRPALRDCAIYVLPARTREGTPRTVLEAMAMGRAVVTTDVPGCRETVRDGDNGFLVPPRDGRRLAEALARFVEQPELVERMGRRGREIAEAKYDVGQVNRSMLEAMELRPGTPL